jgi:hypothetical protein
MFDWNLNTEA